MLERGWQAQCAELRGEAARAEPGLQPGRPALGLPRLRQQITALQNIPVVSWLALGGKCAGCKAPISARYPMVEVLGGLLAACAIWRFGATPQGVAACVLLWSLLALTMIDFDTQLLPDDITLPLLWAGLIVNLWGTFAPLAGRRHRRGGRLPVAVDHLLAVQADPRQGRHGLRRLQAARRARRLARLAGAAA